MNFAFVGLFLLALAGFVRVLEGKADEFDDVSSDQEEDRVARFLRESGKPLSLFCYAIAMGLTMWDALTYQNFAGKIHTVISNDMRGIISFVGSVGLVFSGAVFSNYSKKKFIWLRNSGVVLIVAALTQYGFFTKSANKLNSTNDWLSYYDCKKKIKEWTEEAHLPSIEAGIGDGGKTFYRIDPVPVEVDSLFDWDVEFGVLESEYDQQSVKYGREGYELKHYYAFTDGSGSVRVNALWIKGKDAEPSES